MRHFMYCATAALLLAVLTVSSVTAQTATLQNPVLFVTQTPTPQDSATVASLFGNHSASMMDAPRGGDLWIRYPDGSLKNLTQTAGYGVNGLQGSGAIAVREPSVHWGGTKAVFSMVVGGAASQGDTAQFYWQLYEITGLGKNETPVITKVPNQPAYFNNLSPIYGTDDRIIFTSDRTRTGERHLYPSFDEYKGTPTNTGLWSLNPTTGDLFQLDNSPSGDFSPTIDSYGRLLLMRWDRLQRDRNADIDALGTGNKGTFNYTNESATGQAQFGVRTETFPEPQGSRTDLLNGTNMLGFEFNQFFPWQINEDGTAPETINHLGRHEMRQIFGRAINDDPNVVNFAFNTSGRQNQNPINNLMHLKEDPVTPGTYYGVDAQQSGTHSGGQIVSITAAPTLDPDQTVVTYVTNRATNGITPEGGTPNANHSGFYRNPMPLIDGQLIAAHSPDTHADRNLGNRSNPVSRYTFRLKTLKKSGSNWISDLSLTTGISKTLTYWDVDTLVHFSGTLWELDPVEVRVRQRPTRRTYSLGTPEQQVLSEEGVNESRFRLYLKQNNLAVAVSRDVTHRDAIDKQQPFYLRIAGTTKQSANATGKIYDVSDMQFYQGDYIRGQGMYTANATPRPGRRILAVPLHSVTNAPNPNAPAGSVKLGTDGSMAGFVPARQATTWQLTSPTGTPIVRERYWVTFQPGEIRVCASCHGTNDNATSPKNPIPQNKPEAFRTLVQTWKAQVFPAHTTLVSPAKDTAGTAVQGTLTWQQTAKSDYYRVQVSTSQSFAAPVIDRDSVMGMNTPFSGLANNTLYYWRVRGENAYGDADWSDVWSFTTAAVTSGLAAPVLATPANTATGVSISGAVTWNAVPTAEWYRIQISTQSDFLTTVVDQNNQANTTQSFSGLNPGTKYYWRVSAASSSAGTGPWSQTWSFTTMPAALLAPLLLTPANNATGVAASGTLKWDTVVGAQTYRVQLATAADFQTPIIDQSNLPSALQSYNGLSQNTIYYWRANASNPSAGTSPWSQVWKFTTQAVTGVPVTGSDAGALTLETNHPNPFSNTTTLKFHLPKAGRTSITLYGMRGERIGRVLDADMSSGDHIYELDLRAAGLGDTPSGAYIVRLESEGNMRQMVVVVVK